MKFLQTLTLLSISCTICLHVLVTNSIAECHNGRYGENCSQDCSQNCGGPDKACDNETKTCLLGCTIGYQGAECDIVCDNHTYGENCSEQCSPNCLGPKKTCDNKNGYCDFGCAFGYRGAKCNQEQHFDLNITSIAAVLALACLILVCIVLYFSLRKDAKPASVKETTRIRLEKQQRQSESGNNGMRKIESESGTTVTRMYSTSDTEGYSEDEGPLSQITISDLLTPDSGRYPY